MSNDPTAQMEADIQGLAKKLSPERPTLASIAGNVSVGGLGQATPVATIGAAAVGKRLETLLKRAAELQKAAEVLAVALAGVDAMNPASRGAPTRMATEHLFGKQMAALDELAAVLDSVGRSIERAQRSLT